MKRLIPCALLALALAACGGQQPETPQPSAAAPAPATAEPADTTAAPPAAEPDTSALPESANDGETVEETTSSVSPIAAAVAANTRTTPAPAMRWKAGQHYALLPAAQPVSVGPGQVEVTEIFWYGCGHCYTLEPRLAAWSKSGKPDYVKVVRMPVVWNDVTREDARLFYTLEALDKVEALHLAVFRELHDRRSELTVRLGNGVDQAATERKTRAFLEKNGVSAEDFNKVYRSFAVEGKLRQAENLSKRYMADHTPMAVVQGKYMTDVGMAGGYDTFFEILNDLAARERSGG